MTIEIPWAPPPLNRQLRMHWRERTELTETAAIYICVAAGKKNPPETSKVQVAIQVQRKNQTDEDGEHGACKPIFDALVKLGWAKDDSPEWMHQVMLPTVFGRKLKPKTAIAVEAR